MSCPRPGFIHEMSWIGNPPEHRDWTPDSLNHWPEIDPTAQINAFCTVDCGIEQPTRIGAGTFLMNLCHVGHDAQIGNDVELAAGTIIAGHVVIEDGARLGVAVCVKPRITIGAGARIGAGAVVVHDVPPGEVWVGNPARDIRERDSALWKETYGRESCLDILREASFGEAA